MRSKIGVTIATILAGIPLVASAATVQVNPTITNAHGGTKSAADMTACIQHNSNTECAQGVPTFQISDGESYQIAFKIPAQYTVTTDANCAGTAAGDIVCHVDYEDGPAIPNVSSPLPLQGVIAVDPAPTPAPQQEPVVVPASPQPTVEPVVVSVPAVTQAPAEIAPTPTVSEPESVTLSVQSVTATGTPEQVQQQISLLQKVIAILQQIIAILMAQQNI